ncbi:MAG: IS1595 family transposase [Alicyclobacillus sp.]|nr:IS1595 family transposase [Alicyclobacillus sp.]
MATTKGMTLLEFQRKFPNEQACREHLFQLRWSNGFVCPRCQGNKFYFIEKRMLYECSSCGHQTSLTAGTIMHKTKLPLLVWFWAIYLVAHDKRGRSALSLAQVLSLNYRTAWRLLHKIRHAMQQRDAHYQLAGLVEMDDTYVGAPKSGTDGRGTTKQAVAVALQTDSKGNPQFVRMKVIQRVTIAEIHRVAREVIAAGSTIISDGHSSYKRLTELGYQHVSQDFKRADPDVFLKWLHVVIGNAKAFIEGTYHGLSTRYLQAYLDEFCYRFNRRRNPNELFSRLLNACVSATPAQVS